MGKGRWLLYQETLFGKEPCGITNGHIKLEECSNGEADRVIVKHHYSHKSTQNRFKSFRVNDGKGYLQLGYGIRPHIKHTISKLISPDNYCEFDRMWLSDELPKFSESQVIGLLLRYLRQVYPKIKFVITYADESVGNSGIIYRATNAISLGSVDADFYLLDSGERVHPVSMWHRHKTRAWDTLKVIYPNIKHIKKEFRQFRYLYILDKRVASEYKRQNSSD